MKKISLIIIVLLLITSLWDVKKQVIIQMKNT